LYDLIKKGGEGDKEPFHRGPAPAKEGEERGGRTSTRLIKQIIRRQKTITKPTTNLLLVLEREQKKRKARKKEEKMSVRVG